MLNVNKNMLPIYTSPQKAGLDVRIQKRWLSPSLQNVQEVIYHEENLCFSYSEMSRE